MPSLHYLRLSNAFHDSSILVILEFYLFQISLKHLPYASPNLFWRKNKMLLNQTTKRQSNQKKQNISCELSAYQTMLHVVFTLIPNYFDFCVSLHYLINLLCLQEAYPLNLLLFMYQIATWSMPCTIWQESIISTICLQPYFHVLNELYLN